MVNIFLAVRKSIKGTSAGPIRLSNYQANTIRL